MLLIILLISSVTARDIILSAGVGGWTYEEMWNEYTSYKMYTENKIITTSSILTYFIQENGTLGIYDTGYSKWTAENYQSKIKNDFKIKALPLLYCDETQGACSNLTLRLNNLYNNMSGFIDDTVVKGIKYNWSGYSVDIEPVDTVDMTNVTNFILKWGKKLYDNNMYLSVWIGGGTPYNLTLLYNTSYIKLVTMDTYGLTYSQLIDVIAPTQDYMLDNNNVGFGLLTSNSITDIDLGSIIEWSLISGIDTISLWASKIPPEWYIGLHSFIL